MVTAQSTVMDAHLSRPPKNHPLPKPKKQKQNLRHSSFTGGKQVKEYGEQNACTPSPSFNNPIVEIHTNGYNLITFKFKDGSMAHLNLDLPAGFSASVFKVPEGQVAQIILHYRSKYNDLFAISMVDRKGNTLFKT